MKYIVLTIILFILISFQQPNCNTPYYIDDDTTLKNKIKDTLLVSPKSELNKSLKKKEDTTVYVGLSEQPYLKDEHINDFLSKNIKLPQSYWQSQGGIVYLQFIVEKDSSISNVRIVATTVNDDLNIEALRVIMLTNQQKWIPAKRYGIEPVRMKIKIPVIFPHPDEMKKGY